MAKVTLTDVGAGYQSNNQLNLNNQTIEDAFENTLSRDGTSPNTMLADLDMNSNDILNTNRLYASTVFVNGVALNSGTATIVDEPVFQSRAVAETSDVDSSVQSFFVRGFDSAGDGGWSMWVRVGSEPSHDGKFQTNDGAWWEYKPIFGIICAAAFGFLPANTASVNTTNGQKFADYMNAQGSLIRGWIVPGTYQVNGTMSFTNASTRWHMEAHGVKFVQEATSGAIVELNSSATAADGNNSSYITWEGGHFYHNVAYLTTANTCTGILARVITRLAIRDCEFRDLHRGLTINALDAILVENCHGFNNDIHVFIEDYQTGTSNPQDITFINLGLSKHYSAGMLFEGNVNMVTIEGGYNVGSRAIMAENASQASNNNGLHIDGVDFEQGQVVTLTGTWTYSTGSTTITSASGAATTELVAGDRIVTAGNNVYTVASVTDDDNVVLTANPTANESTVASYRADPYIDIRDTDSGILRNLVVENSKFSGFTAGPNTEAHILQCRHTLGVTFENNEVASKAPGWLWFDADCEMIDIGQVVHTGTDNFIHYDCDRLEIRMYPYVIDFSAYNGSNDNIIFSNTAKSSGDSATLTMSTELGGGYPDYIDPRGYDFALSARDAGSAGASPDTVYASVVPSSGTAAGDRYRYVDVPLTLHNNDTRISNQGYCPADSDGNVYALFSTSGTNTMDVYLTVKRIYI